MTFCVNGELLICNNIATFLFDFVFVTYYGFNHMNHKHSFTVQVVHTVEP